VTFINELIATDIGSLTNSGEFLLAVTCHMQLSVVLLAQSALMILSWFIFLFTDGLHIFGNQFTITYNFSIMFTSTYTFSIMYYHDMRHWRLEASDEHVGYSCHCSKMSPII
jgi:hypothetical protein